MTAPDRTYDRVRFHRGSRGFAAFVTGLNASILLGLALFATPSLGLSQPAASWFVILAGGAGIAHVAAVVGLIRGRAWSGALVGYLAAAGIAVAGFGALAAATGLEIVGAERGTALGFFIWMIGSWLVATRYAVRPFTYTRPQPRQAHRRVERPAPDARPQTGLRKLRRPATVSAARPSRPLPTPRIVHPMPAARGPAGRDGDRHLVDRVTRGQAPAAGVAGASRHPIGLTGNVLWSRDRHLSYQDMTFARFRAGAAASRMAAMDTSGWSSSRSALSPCWRSPR